MFRFLAALIPPWAIWIGAALVVGSIVTWHFVKVDGAKRAGRAEIQAKWDAYEVERASTAARDALRRTEANIGVTDAHNKRVAKIAAGAADARSELVRLLDTLSAHRPEPAAPGAGADEGPTAADLLGQCSSRYADVAAVADGAITQVIGLQAYVTDVCLSRAPGN